MMKSRRLVLILELATLAALALAVAPAGLAAQSGSFHRQYTLTGPVVLQVENGSGDVSITSMPGTSVTVDATIRLQSSFFFGANPKVIGEIEQHPPIERNGNTIRITRVDHGWADHVSIKYAITAPPATAADIRTGSGDITLAGLERDATLAAGSGDLRVDDLTGNLHASTGSGDISLGTVTGNADLSTGSGEIRGDEVTGQLSAHSGSGDVRVRTVGAGARVRTASGEVELDTVSGDVDAHAASGDVHVGGRLSGNESWRVGAASGDVSLALASHSFARLNLDASSGGIHVSLPQRDTRIGRRSWEGTVGDGAGAPTASLVVHTASGGITVH